MARAEGDKSTDRKKGPKKLSLDDTDSNAMEPFEEELLKVRNNIYSLNPWTGCRTGDKWSDAILSSKALTELKIQEQQKELSTASEDLQPESVKREELLQSLFKSAVVNTFDVFEVYIHDLFEEAFNYTCWRSESTKCETVWPAMTGLDGRKKQKYTNTDEKKTKFEDNDGNEDVRQYILRHHRDDTLRKLTPRITTMKETLNQLFDLDDKTVNLLPNPKSDAQTILKEFPIELLVDNESFSTKWSIGVDGNKEEHHIIIRTIDTVTHILNLFYAIRCISVHGYAKQTVDGALAKFPKANAQRRTLDLGISKVEKYLFDIHDQIINEQLEDEQLKVDYLLCLNVSRFIRTVAMGLHRVLGYFIYYQLQHNKEVPDDQMKFWGLIRYKPAEPMVIPCTAIRRRTEARPLVASADRCK